MKLSKVTKKINELDEFYAEVEGENLYIRQKSDGDYFVRFNLRENDLYIDDSILAQHLNDDAFTALKIIRKYLNTSVSKRGLPKRYVLPLGKGIDGIENYLQLDLNGLCVKLEGAQGAYTEEELDMAKEQFPALATLIEDIKKEEK